MWPQPTRVYHPQYFHKWMVNIPVAKYRLAFGFHAHFNLNGLVYGKIYWNRNPLIGFPVDFTMERSQLVPELNPRPSPPQLSQSRRSPVLKTRPRDVDLAGKNRGDGNGIGERSIFYGFEKTPDTLVFMDFWVVNLWTCCDPIWTNHILGWIICSINDRSRIIE